jgi:predicted lipid-binding transport protein (Tim44 family)
MGSVWVVVLGVALLAGLAWGVLRLLAGRQDARGTVLGGASLASGQSQLDPVTPRGYSPRNVGNDSSARPWESAYSEPPTDAFDAAWLPEGFDVQAFLSASKTNFVSLQDAWNRADTATLRAMMTADMLDQIQPQLTEREQQPGGAVGKTEVIMVDARLLGVEDLGQGHMASVEFSGLLREDGAGPSPFREIWSISRAKSGDGGWLVAAVQALQ